jgi:hypothetical protein
MNDVAAFGLLWFGSLIAVVEPLLLLRSMGLMTTAIAVELFFGGPRPIAEDATSRVSHLSCGAR